MLQHNVTQTGRQAHIAHALVVSLHALCCGLPVLALLAAGLSGAAAGVVQFAEYTNIFHALLHSYEVWVLLASLGLVLLGAGLEYAVRRRHRDVAFPWLFALSVSCFFLNVAIIASHRFA
jgi:hypothetical protein